MDAEKHPSDMTNEEKALVPEWSPSAPDGSIRKMTFAPTEGRDILAWHHNGMAWNFVKHTGENKWYRIPV